MLLRFRWNALGSCRGREKEGESLVGSQAFVPFKVTDETLAELIIIIIIIIHGRLHYSRK